MTPEERATVVLREYRRKTGGVMADPLFVGRAIAVAIRAAVDDERADLARDCEALTMRRAAEMGLASYEHLTGWQCAALIRARGKVEIPT